ncbi:MAG: alpha/beta fold hydrolase [Saccharothrix sp.]|nr:alpha/beta fold hydrolase [Saccharothrix sp.]
MTTYVLVHGAWHGPWAWDRVVPLLHAAGARTLTPDLTTGGDHGLHDDAKTVVTALDQVEDDVVLVGHSYAGLVVREAADARPDRVRHLVLVDGWAGPDGKSLVDLAPDAFGTAVRAAADARGLIPAPAPAQFGITEPDDATWLAARLVPQPLRVFTEPTHLTGAVDRVPGTAVCCLPETYPFAAFGAAVGYRVRTLESPHDAPLARPEPLARVLLDLQEGEAPALQ